jgi:hypothetical protein
MAQDCFGGVLNQQIYIAGAGLKGIGRSRSENLQPLHAEPPAEFRDGFSMLFEERGAYPYSIG